jgi:flagellar hook-length control protein FliK
VPAEAASSVEGGPLLSSGVDLEEMIDSIHATIELAARQGMSQARIALQPAELGQIRIHLSQTSEGLLARVTADTPAAAQALNASRLELHQSLSSLGSTLLRLDIGSFNQPEGRDAAGAAGAGSSGRGRTTDGEGNIDQIDEPNESGPTQRLPLGGLVDVLA